MPRCLHLHQVPPTAGFCAVCGARVLPDWVWLCLCALPLSLIYGAFVSTRPLPPPIVVTRIITPTEPAPTPTGPLPTATASPTWTSTPTPLRTWTPTPSPTPTLFPRAALLSFRDLYVIAKRADEGWVLKQEARLDDPCGWFTLSRQANGKVALLTCNNRYVTAPRTGMTRPDWLLRQELKLNDCGEFDLLELPNAEVAFKSCAGRLFTPGDGTWLGLEWLVVAETKEMLDWERFKLQPP
jgi:hypothetical protein